MSATGTDVVVAPALVPMSPDDAREAMERWQAFTAAMLVETDWQTIPTGKFVKRSGWRKIATGYTLSCEILEDEVIERHPETFEPTRARAKARVIHRETGRYFEGTGRCSATEARFRRGDAKMEHDITATAVTRAINRATADLVGFGQVSAEEVDGSVAVAAETPPLTDAALNTVAAALQEAWPHLDGHRFVRMLRKRFEGRVPEAVGTALMAWTWFATEYTGATGNARETGSEAPQTTDSTTTPPEA